MYNAHSYAYNIEKLFKLPLHEADKIAHNPLEYLKGFLDKEYDKSEEKANLIEKKATTRLSLQCSNLIISILSYLTVCDNRIFIYFWNPKDSENNRKSPKMGIYNNLHM